MMQRSLVTRIPQIGVNNHAQKMAGFEMFSTLETKSID
jgi:hypothetical protein